MPPARPTGDHTVLAGGTEMSALRQNAGGDATAAQGSGRGRGWGRVAAVCALQTRGARYGRATAHVRPTAGASSIAESNRSSAEHMRSPSPHLIWWHGVALQPTFTACACAQAASIWTSTVHLCSMLGGMPVANLRPGHAGSSKQHSSRRC